MKIKQPFTDKEIDILEAAGGVAILAVLLAFLFIRLI